MKSVFLVALASLVAVGCYPRKGALYEGYDEFSQIQEKRVVLGSAESNNFGFMSKVIPELCKQDREGKEEAEYCFQFNVSKEADLIGTDFPVSSGSTIMLLVGDDRCEFDICGVQKKRFHGWLNFAHTSLFKIGPLPEFVLAAIRDGRAIKYKISGVETDIIGAIGAAQLQEAKKLFCNA